MQILVIGAGLAGCVASLELADNGANVTVIDVADSVGGKVRHYGCKAADKCSNCGLCLAAGLWEKIENHNNITLHLSTQLIDLIQENGKCTAILKNTIVKDLDRVIVSVGFEPSSFKYSRDIIITGSQIERLLSNRTNSSFFETSPKSVAFIQCHGSRDYHEHTMYCSRVCCGYSTRVAKIIRHHYPECRVVFFYMEMQTVNQGDYYQSLLDTGIEFIKCRPVEITSDCKGFASVIYDEPSSGKRMQDFFDLIVLAEGIKPNIQSLYLSEICEFGQDEAGFLQYINTNNPNVFLIGCASGPKNIAETYAESIAAAKEILQSQEAFI